MPVGEGRERAWLLERVDVVPVERTVECAVEYVLKGLPRRRCTVDDLFVLPRSLADMARLISPQPAYISRP